MELLKYEGFILEDAPQGYKSNINGEYKFFKKVILWREFIDLLLGSTEKLEK